MKDKYILELDRKQAIMLGSMVLKQGLYKTSYEPLIDLCRQIDTICGEINIKRIYEQYIKEILQQNSVL
jgi:hypothetical protein